MSRVSNKNKFLKFVELLKHYKYEVYDIQYGDGYFICEHGKDRVVRFKVKGCRGWRFGVWLNTLSVLERKQKYKEKKGSMSGFEYDNDYNYELDFFFQYEKDVDKFKPSASHFSFKINNENYNYEKWHKNYRPDFVKALDLVKKHRQVARYGQDVYWKSATHCFILNLEKDLYEIKNKVKKWCYRLSFFALCKLRWGWKCKLRNKNSKNSGWHIYPEWEVKIPHCSQKFYDKTWDWCNKAEISLECDRYEETI